MPIVHTFELTDDAPTPITGLVLIPDPLLLSTGASAISGDPRFFVANEIDDQFDLFISANTYALRSQGVTYVDYEIGNQKFSQSFCGPCGGSTVPTPPPQGDAPVPPIFPNTTPTGNIFQRDHWNMNIKMIRARTFIFKAIAFDDGERVDLTGATLTFTAKWETTDSVGLIVASNASDGITVTDAINGEFTVEITPAKTDIVAVPYHRIDLYYDVEYINTDVPARKYSLLRGTLTIEPNVTA